MALGRLLFRQEAIDFQEQQRHWGDVALLQPVSIRVLAWGVTAIMVFSVTFLSLAEFARKQTVVGYLTPAAGTSKVFATRAGTTTAVYVIEGQEVQNGQPLLTIATPEITASGEDVKATKLEGLGREKDLLEEQIQTQSERVKLAQGLVDAAKYLLARGEISGVECKRREDTLLEHQQTLTSLRRQVAEKTQQIADIEGSSAYTLRAARRRAHFIAASRSWADGGAAAPAGRNRTHRQRFTSGTIHSDAGSRLRGGRTAGPVSL